VKKKEERVKISGILKLKGLSQEIEIGGGYYLWTGYN
jgi:hypothetical protein